MSAGRAAPPRAVLDDAVPDVRDGLTRRERVVLTTLRALQRERGEGRFVPTAQLYGRVVERLDIAPQELTEILVRLGARGRP
ncbi:MAG: hypothetical protein AAGN82_17580 [Myxococcota bacterium]